MSLLSHWLFPHESNNQRARFLHPSSIGLIIGLFTLSQLFLDFSSARFIHILGYASQISPQELVTLTNAQRRAKGLADLRLDPQLNQAALAKAGDMFAKDYWAHVSPAGTQPWYFISQANYTYRYAGENLARDFSDPVSVVKAWMDSPTHRENLLSHRYQDMGLAVVDGTLGGKETTLVVQVFGTKLEAASSVGTTGQNTLVPAVHAQTAVSPSVLSSQPKISPFSVTKAISISLLTLCIGVIVIDILVVNRRQISRWTSRSTAHFIFLFVILLGVIIVTRGQIL